MTLLGSAYVNRHWHVSVCIMFLLFFQYLRFDQKPDVAYCFFIFCATLAAYNLHDLPLPSDSLSISVKKHFSLIAGLAGSVISVFFLDAIYYLYIIPVIVFTISYILPVYPGRKKLRDYPWVKVFVVVMVLVYSVIVVPGILVDVHPAALLYHTTAGIFFVFLVALLFDILDTGVDSINGTKSLPLFFGITKIKKIAYILSIIGLTAEFLLANQFILDLPEFISMAITYMGLVFFYFKISNKTPKIVYSFFGDGLLAVPYLLYSLIML